MKKITLGITMGDPAGIGPEIIAKALSDESLLQVCRPLIIGSERYLKRAFEFTGCPLSYQMWDSSGEVPDEFEGIGLLNDEFLIDESLPFAEIDPSCGASAFAWLDEAITMALSQKIDAIVTAPLHKEALNQAGHFYAGHTEILAEKTETKDYSLMLISGDFRVVHVTCHVALKDVSPFLTTENITKTIRLFDQALTRLDGKRPRIAVCAFNPHNGEGGLFGNEELRVIAPAVHLCCRDGIQAFGPFPSDSIYPQHVGGVYDGVVAMYHDQGHIAFKMANFHFDSGKKEWSTVTGVNVTLGLPIIRTSVDHGTAFDLAGTGKASERSLLDAIHAAIKLASQ